MENDKQSVYALIERELGILPPFTEQQIKAKFRELAKEDTLMLVETMLVL